MNLAGTIKIGNYTVNRMGFGAMRVTGAGAWGLPDNIDLAKQVLTRAAELGVNFFDTADAYGPGVSEELLHDTLAPYKGMVIATKGGMTRPSREQWVTDGSENHLRAAVAASQRRLGIQKLPLYQLHWPDPQVPLEDSIKALAKEQQDGNIEYIGLSNVSLAQLKAAEKITSIVSVQNRYNVFDRTHEDVLQYCEQNGIVFIPYAPIDGGAALKNKHLLAVARKHRAEPQQICLAWLLAHSPAMLPIPGTGTIEHLEANIEAATITLSSADMQQLDQIADGS